jgi:hypothetical protein
MGPVESETKSLFEKIVKIIYEGVFRRSAEKRGARIYEKLWRVGVPRGRGVWMVNRTYIDGANRLKGDTHPQILMKMDSGFGSTYSSG